MYDFWNSKFVGVFENGFLLSVAPFDTAVLRITPVAENGLPTLISSSRHITQGGYELTALEYDEENKTLSGKVKCVENEVCRLSFYLSGTEKVDACGGKWIQNGSCGELHVGGNEGGEIKWSLKIC